MFCGVHWPSVNGPVATGWLTTCVDGSLYVDQMCCGTMLTWFATWKNAGAAACVNVRTTSSLPLLVTLESSDHTDCRSMAGNCLSRLNVNTTSSAENDWPSLHCTPERMVNVSCVLSE